jgi:type I restriction enzyme S subunit
MSASSCKVIEIGEIPDDWKLRPIGEICHKPQYGYTASATEKAVGAKFLRITDIKDGRVNWDEVPYCDCPDEVIDNYILRPGDILFARTGSTGKSFLISSCPRAIFGSYLIRLRAKSDVDVQYLSYFLDSSCYWKQVSQKIGGSIQSGINASVLSSIQVPIASLGEQRKIASVLCTVDDAIQKTDEIIAKTQQLKKGLMQQLLSKGIGHTKFTDTDIGAIPNEWQLLKLVDVCKVIPGYAFKSSEFVKSGVKLLRGTNVGIEEIRWDDTKYFPQKRLPTFPNYILQGGEIVIGMDRPFVREGLKVSRLSYQDAPCLLVQRVGKFVPSEKLDAEFLYNYLRSKVFRTHLRLQQQGMDLPHISQTDIETAPLALPDKEEQKAIGEILATLDSKILIVTDHKLELVALRKGLMQVLLTGKVRVKVN